MEKYAIHNLYQHPENPEWWIHEIKPKPSIHMPMIVNNKQNQKLGVNGKKKINRCNHCSFPKKKCKCHNKNTYSDGKKLLTPSELST
jgi:hypothetical protein